MSFKVLLSLLSVTFEPVGDLVGGFETERIAEYDGINVVCIDVRVGELVVVGTTDGGAKAENEFLGVGEIEVDFPGSNACVIEGWFDGSSGNTINGACELITDGNLTDGWDDITERVGNTGVWVKKGENVRALDGSDVGASESLGCSFDCEVVGAKETVEEGKLIGLSVGLIDGPKMLLRFEVSDAGILGRDDNVDFGV